MKRQTVQITLAKNVQRKLEELDTTQEKVAKRAQLRQAVISEIMNAKANPTLNTLIRLADGLETTVPELLT